LNGSGCKKKQSTGGGSGGVAWRQRKMEVAENKKEKVNNQPEVCVYLHAYKRYLKND